MATRHNFGFLLLDGVYQSLREQGYSPALSQQRPGDARLEVFELVSGPVALMWPLTYMNLSGEAVLRWLSQESLQGFDSKEQLLVAFDDMSLALGRLRIRAKGSPGGHNGLKSMEANLGHSEYSRLKLGIGRPESSEQIIDHVLSPFTPTEQELLDQVLKFCVPKAYAWLTGASVGDLAQSVNGWKPEQEGTQDKVDNTAEDK